MNRNTVGALVIVSICVLIGFGMWVTQSPAPLWALFIVLWFAQGYTWETKEN